MEMIFPWRTENLKESAQDDFRRKELIRKALLLRGILVWAAFPMVIALVGVAVMLLSHLAFLLRDKSRVSDFFNLTDIVYPAVGILTVFSFASLIAVYFTDRRIRLLSSLKDDDPLPVEEKEGKGPPLEPAGIGNSSGAEDLPRPPGTKRKSPESSAIDAE